MKKEGQQTGQRQRVKSDLKLVPLNKLKKPTTGQGPDGLAEGSEGNRREGRKKRERKVGQRQSRQRRLPSMWSDPRHYLGF